MTGYGWTYRDRLTKKGNFMRCMYAANYTLYELCILLMIIKLQPFTVNLIRRCVGRQVASPKVITVLQNVIKYFSCINGRDANKCISLQFGKYYIS